MGQSSFEEKWNEAFEGAEMTPSDGVWTGVEANIANREAARYKRKVVYYRWAVAASVLIIASLLGYYGFQSTENTADSLSDTDIVENTNNQDSQTPTNDSPSSDASELAQAQDMDGVNSESQSKITDKSSGTSPINTDAASNTPSGLKEQPDVSTDEIINNKTTLAQQGVPQKQVTPNSEGLTTTNQDHQAASSTQENFADAGTTKLSDDKVSTEGIRKGHLGTENPGQLAAVDGLEEHSDAHESTTATESFAASHQGIIAINSVNSLGIDEEAALQPPLNPDHLYGVALHPTEQPKASTGTQLWAGIDLAPRRFDPNYRLDNGLTEDLALSPDNLSSSLTPREETNSGFSWAVSFDMGMKLGDKWELNSGLQYARSTSRSATNTAIDQIPVFSSVVRSLDLIDQESGALRLAPTDLDNDFQFLTIPLEAGYRVLDGKFQVSINAGFAADFFLQNTLSPSDPSLDEVTISPGSNSPYRSVYFNGLLGAQASYEFLPRYSLTLQPQYRVALNRFTKQSNDYRSFPTSLGIGFGVKYNFK